MKAFSSVLSLNVMQVLLVHCFTPSSIASKASAFSSDIEMGISTFYACEDIILLRKINHLGREFDFKSYAKTDIRFSSEIVRGKVGHNFFMNLIASYL